MVLNHLRYTSRRLGTMVGIDEYTQLLYDEYCWEQYCFTGTVIVSVCVTILVVLVTTITLVCRRNKQTTIKENVTKTENTECDLDASSTRPDLLQSSTAQETTKLSEKNSDTETFKAEDSSSCQVHVGGRLLSEGTNPADDSGLAKLEDYLSYSEDPSDYESSLDVEVLEQLKRCQMVIEQLQEKLEGEKKKVGLLLDENTQLNACLNREAELRKTVEENTVVLESQLEERNRDMDLAQLQIEDLEDEVFRLSELNADYGDSRTIGYNNNNHEGLARQRFSSGKGSRIPSKLPTSSGMRRLNPNQSPAITPEKAAGYRLTSTGDSPSESEPPSPSVTSPRNCQEEDEEIDEDMLRTAYNAICGRPSDSQPLQSGSEEGNKDQIIHPSIGDVKNTKEFWESMALSHDIESPREGRLGNFDVTRNKQKLWESAMSDGIEMDKTILAQICMLELEQDLSNEVDENNVDDDSYDDDEDADRSINTTWSNDLHTGHLKSDNIPTPEPVVTELPHDNLPSSFNSAPENEDFLIKYTPGT